MNITLDSFKQFAYPIISSFVIRILFFLLFINKINIVQREFRIRATTDLDLESDIIELKINSGHAEVIAVGVFIKDSLKQYTELNLKRLNSFARYVFDSRININLITISLKGIIQYIVPQAGNEMIFSYNPLMRKLRVNSCNVQVS